MARFQQVFFLIVISFISACSENPETFAEHKPILSIDCVPQVDSLNEKILLSITPLFPDKDTIVLDDQFRIYCGNASTQEIASDFFPMTSYPSIYSRFGDIYGKTILLSSKLDGNRRLEAIYLSLEGTIISKDSMLIEESQSIGSENCQIEKWFIYSNGKWACQIKHNTCQ